MVSLHDGLRPGPTLGLERTQAIDGGARPGSLDDVVTLQDKTDTIPGEVEDGPPHEPEPEPDRLRRGDAIGRFVMLELLGVGGMGEVYLCYDPELDRRVAVKLLRPLRSGRAEEARARLVREARSIARLSHPNVVTVHDVAVWQDRVFLAMEYVAGPTLAAWARAQAGDTAAIVAVYCQAGEGLAAAHRAGLIHRDFKPKQSRLSQKAPISANAVDLHQSGLLRGRRSGQGWSGVVRMAQTWPKSWARSGRGASLESDRGRG
nr:serine/threonine-protein kinase [Nannocystis sp.]